jgi:hypothetical protein
MIEIRKKKVSVNPRVGINIDMNYQMVCNNEIICFKNIHIKLFILSLIIVMQTITYSQISFDANFESGNINTVTTLKQALTSLQTFIFAI